MFSDQMDEEIKVCIWEKFPRRYPHYFYEQVRKQNTIQLLVMYYGKKQNRPRQLTKVETLLPGDAFVDANVDNLFSLEGWKSYIHIVSGARDSFLRKLIAAFIKHDVKWINWAEGIRKDRKWPFKYVYYKIFCRYVEKYALGTFGISERAIKQFINLGVSKDKVFLLPYSFKLLDIKRKTDKKINSFGSGRKVFMHCGELSHRKATDILVTAFHKLKQDNWVLVLVGRDTTNGQTHQMIKDLNLEDSVLIRGPVAYEHITDVMNHCDVFILPSRFDGWGAVLNEMASLKKPLISTYSCGAAEHLIVEDRNGYVVAAEDVDGLANAMQKYVDNERLIRSHGEESFKILKDFTVESNIKRMHDGILEMLAVRDKMA
jgi:glycosyltransferase involved in cell wall biosynthesis